ncbi:hypothetical protein EMIHUDRAFT_233680 [Emiliania huxleyi CCMP1516]|uniref:Methyltransferase FkbM domain-containing protein n=2 Tax=Emiliania huxleyi TaxID=2903 RepID=A0A0D3K1H6_EMIH1|nr:hypothetical protein EMIHUDRAFT_233680 [Emiliania huxleyi CCMP1516]EOD29611.1 hypothetical protein EMIHUDRAFT_233680 [Emiliania huxleyi CCMP1516]|eukprot:XP_005782040.1 hypothetical protein EMIHUDRAFT_233680 [Emiliania huxleyi CCMP1516]
MCFCAAAITFDGSGAGNRLVTGLEQDLLKELYAASAGTKAVVVDVGANNGGWSLAWAQHKRRTARLHNKNLDIIMLEPQPQFTTPLTLMAQEHGFRFISAAASDAEGEIPFMSIEGSRSTEAHAVVSGLSNTVNDSARPVWVRSLDLAAFFRAQLSEGGLNLVKLDVEGLEFKLLPWLLAQGALCGRVRYLIVEWHVNAVDPTERLSALAQRLAFSQMLRNGCGRSAPVAVFNDDYMPNNVAIPVPGLSRVLLEHSSWAGKSMGGIHISSTTVNFENADHKFFAEAPRGNEGELTKANCQATVRQMWKHRQPVVQAGLMQMGKIDNRTHEQHAKTTQAKFRWRIQMQFFLTSLLVFT